MIYGNYTWTKFNVGPVLRQKLLGDPEVRALVNDRIWPLEKLEAAQDGPYILYEMSEYRCDTTKQGIYNESVSFWVGCMSADYDETMKIAEAVYRCLMGVYDYKDDTRRVIINNITITDLQQGFLNDKFQTTLKFRIELVIKKKL